MKICAVVVTYGNRFFLLNQVIDSLVYNAVSRIIVVDNNSYEESREQLREREKELQGLLTIIRLHENTGSAGGYKTGLISARACRDVDFIWLLDDDNVPAPNALMALKSFWANFDMSNKDERLCLLSFRKDRLVYKELARRDSSSIEPIIGSRNSFLGFNILQLFSLRKKPNIFSGTLNEDDIIMNTNFGKVPVAPYGGMFFNKLLLDIIGYPDERFFLYGDDYEFSHRIIKHNGEIILLLDSGITDIDVSDNKGFDCDEQNLFRLYYSTRNNVYFQKTLATNKLLYSINRLLFWPIFKVGTSILSTFQQKDKIKTKIMLSAIRNGFREKLGKCEKFY